MWSILGAPRTGFCWWDVLASPPAAALINVMLAISGLVSVIVAAIALVVAVRTLRGQAAGQRRMALVSRLVERDRQLTRRLDNLKEVAAANVRMAIGMAEMRQHMPNIRFEHARGDLLVALTAFENDELPASRAVAAFDRTTDQYDAVRDQATLEIDAQRLLAMTERNGVTAELDSLLSSDARGE
jgi:hypothetical protein